MTNHELHEVCDSRLGCVPGRWSVRKRGDQWTAVHSRLGVRGVVSNWAAAFGVAYRAAVKEGERG